MKGKKYFFIIVSAATLIYPLSVIAVGPPSVRLTEQAARKEARDEFKQTMQDLRNSATHSSQNLKSKAAKIIGGEITATSGATLTVTKDGKTYTVNTDSSTQFRRHFWGKSSLSEFSVGDLVNVHGKFTDEAHATILARMVRNLSIMKRYGVFFGDVTAKNADNFVISSKQRGTQTVFFNLSTKFIKRNQTAMTYADLLVGHRVRVRGLWDKKLSKITNVKEVKDFSLPPLPSVTAGATGAVTPSPTSGPTTVPTSTPTEVPTSTPTPTLTPSPTLTPTPTP